MGMLTNVEMETIEGETQAKRVACISEAFNIMRTLFSHGVLFRVSVMSSHIHFRFEGFTHIETAQRILPDSSIAVNDNEASLILVWEKGNEILYAKLIAQVKHRVVEIVKPTPNEWYSYKMEKIHNERTKGENAK